MVPLVRRRARSWTCLYTLETQAPPQCCTLWAPRTQPARWVLPVSLCRAVRPRQLAALHPPHPPTPAWQPGLAGCTSPHSTAALWLQVITLDTAGANYRSVWAMHKHFPHVKTFVRAFDIENGGLVVLVWRLPHAGSHRPSWGLGGSLRGGFAGAPGLPRCCSC